MKKIIVLLLVIGLSLFCVTAALQTTVKEVTSSINMDGPNDVPSQVLPL